MQIRGSRSALVFAFVPLVVLGVAALLLTALLAPWSAWLIALLGVPAMFLWAWFKVNLVVTIDDAGWTIDSGTSTISLPWEDLSWIKVSPSFPHLIVRIRDGSARDFSFAQWGYWWSTRRSRAVVERILEELRQYPGMATVDVLAQEDLGAGYAAGTATFSRTVRRPSAAALLGWVVAPLLFGVLLGLWRLLAQL